MAIKKKVATETKGKTAVKKVTKKIVKKATEIKNSLFRQGDVLIKMVKELPEDAKRIVHDVKLNKWVLAYGEVTGHAHALSLAGVAMYEKAGATYLEVIKESADLKHEEHSTITLPAGTYEIIHQKEYTNKDMTRRVAD